MRIILAPDKFKGSLTANEFCAAVEKGIKNVIPTAEIVKLPLADGGDGTIDVINYYLNGKEQQLEVKDPFFRSIKASYLYAEAAHTAFIEMAEASGIKLLKQEELDCKNATTFGTGQLIKEAIHKGATTIILGIGGSATNDCGIGMATALGYRFLNDDKKDVKPIGRNLLEIMSIDDSAVEPKLKGVTFKIACDVTNPLYGKNGAAYVYAAQKGASKDDIIALDTGLKQFSKVLQNKYNVQVQDVPGAGAAGGMGIATKLFLKGELVSGIEMMLELADFEHKIRQADWIITGEGKLDQQTLSGKTIHGIVKKAKEQHIRVAAFCGGTELTNQEAAQIGITYLDTLLGRAENLNDAMLNSKALLVKIAEEFSRNLITNEC